MPRGIKIASLEMGSMYKKTKVDLAILSVHPKDRVNTNSVKPNKGCLSCSSAVVLGVCCESVIPYARCRCVKGCNVIQGVRCSLAMSCKQCFPLLSMAVVGCRGAGDRTKARIKW